MTFLFFGSSSSNKCSLRLFAPHFSDDCAFLQFIPPRSTSLPVVFIVFYESWMDPFWPGSLPRPHLGLTINTVFWGPFPVCFVFPFRHRTVVRQARALVDQETTVCLPPSPGGRAESLFCPVFCPFIKVFPFRIILTDYFRPTVPFTPPPPVALIFFSSPGHPLDILTSTCPPTLQNLHLFNLGDTPSGPQRCGPPRSVCSRSVFRRQTVFFFPFYNPFWYFHIFHLSVALSFPFGGLPLSSFIFEFLPSEACLPIFAKIFFVAFFWFADVSVPPKMVRFPQLPGSWIPPTFSFRLLTRI